MKSEKVSNDSDDCVCNVIRRIVEVQDEVGGNNSSSGCDRSIQQLLSKRTGNDLGSGNTTIPFILYCDGTCEPFVGSGVFQASNGANRGTFFGCVETPIFRAKHFVKGSDCCVRLELLVPVTLLTFIGGCTATTLFNSIVDTVVFKRKAGHFS